MSAELAFDVANVIVLPWWACWIAAPRSRIAARLASHMGVFAILGILYAGLIAAALVGGALGGVAPGAEPGGFESMRAALTTPLGFLAGWVHYLCFDLFVGAWIVRESQRLDLAPRVALFFTLMLGPFGLLLFSLRRWHRLRHFGQLGEGDLA